MESVLESIVVKGKNIDHILVADLLSGEKVVDALTQEDATIIEQAINAKFRVIVDEIQKGFFQLGELEEQTRYSNSKISKDSVDFNFSTGWNSRFFLRYYIHHKRYSNGSDDLMNEIVVYWENGTDKGNAYGQKIDEVTRRYKIKSLAKSVKTLDTILYRFLDLKIPLLEAYNEKIENDKAQRVILKRKELQKKFKKHHDDLDILKSLATDYDLSGHSGSILFYDRIILKGKAELKRIMKLGEVAWIASNGKDYENLRLFL